LTKEICGETDSKIGLQIVHFFKLAKTGYRQKVEDLVYTTMLSISEKAVKKSFFAVLLPQ
jgi:hypothetical protein